eukprot:8693682-Pyramimonas_sp.AAC.1
MLIVSLCSLLRSTLFKYQKQLKEMKHAKAQLLATAADQDQSDRAQYENWANGCKKCVDNADEHETKMEIPPAKIDNTAPVGKDPDMHVKVKDEAFAAHSTMEHMYDGDPA